MKKIFSVAFFIFVSTLSLADTPSSSTPRILGNTDNTLIGNVSDSLKVDVTNAIPVTIPTPVPVTQSTSPWVISGNVGRTWSLFHSTDSISDWLFDGSGNPIGSTSGALNSFLTNSSIAVTGTF